MHRPSGMTVVTAGWGRWYWFTSFGAGTRGTPSLGRSRACRRRARHSTSARPSSCIRGPGARGPLLPRRRRSRHLPHSLRRKRHQPTGVAPPAPEAPAATPAEPLPPPVRRVPIQQITRHEAPSMPPPQARRRQPGRAVRAARRQGASRAHPASRRRADGALRARRRGWPLLLQVTQATATPTARSAPRAPSAPAARRRHRRAQPSSVPPSSRSSSETASDGSRVGRSHAVEGMARATGLEPATSGVTGRRSNQLSYARNPNSAPRPLPTGALSRGVRLRERDSPVKRTRPSRRRKRRSACSPDHARGRRHGGR